jgi:hypothetical protein
MEAACSSETLVATYHKTDDHNLNSPASNLRRIMCNENYVLSKVSHFFEMGIIPYCRLIVLNVIFCLQV